MHYQPTCETCKCAMELGFVADRADEGISRLQRWCRGMPEQGFLGLTEVRTSQARAGSPVTAYRCPNCKVLRFYAPDVPTQ